MREVGFSPILPGGQFVDERISLNFLISFAYNVSHPDIELLGLPDWAKRESYSIAAKPAAGSSALPPAENREQVRLMVRSMLEDRFSLRIHNETRQGGVFYLEVAKGGLLVKEVEPPVPPAQGSPVGAAMGDRSGRMIGRKSTMGSLASALTVFLKRPVLDHTGLGGYYDFDIKWSSPDAPASSDSGFGAEGIGLLISALHGQLGLRLTSATGPVSYWIVDHVEPPTPN
jgi:uncharacterized protein (TIGR03435 family)